MKSIKNIALFLFVSLSFGSKAQLVATVKMKKNIEGICNHDAVYSLYKGFEGQIEPECSISKEQMEAILNEKLLFLKTNPKFKSEGMVGVFINCEGVALEWDVSVKSKSVELDQQILEVFKTFEEWTAGKFNSKPVDTRELISYKIKQGKIKLN